MEEGEFSATAGHRSRKRGEAREGFELERVVSYCSGDYWWRTKLDAHEAFGTDVQQEATQDLSTGTLFS